ncbi:hypothetical protein PFLUV_G00042470 [Perca fluviatilis]|uniref:GH18 domain-containing protein n=1 Tax=Perca fluviatilis TaxID=8168 RepID=A0A6A5FBZ2_PERFL|nr:hypothetical protein PFLUV_G00042470 [Perca fluviatilis]
MLRENSPLYKGPADQGSMIYFNVDYAMNYWKSNGAPAEKLLVGFPTYGHTLPLWLPLTLLWELLPVDLELLDLSPICTFLKQGATQAWDSPQDVPYAYNQGTWVGYDNVKSFQVKWHFLWRPGKIPLINTIKSGLGTGASCTSRVDPLAPGATNPAYAPAMSPALAAQRQQQRWQQHRIWILRWRKSHGLYPDPTNKNHFYECDQGNTYGTSTSGAAGVR